MKRERARPRICHARSRSGKAADLDRARALSRRGSRVLVSDGAQRPSSVEEDRLVDTLQDDVEAKEAGRARVGLGQQRAAAVRGDEGEDRIGGVGGVALKIDAREEPLQEPARK